MLEFIYSTDESIKINFNGNNKTNIANTSMQLDYTKIFEDYNKAIELKPDLAVAYYNRANLKVQAGLFDGALSDFSKAIKLEPEFADAFYNLALLFIHLQENAKACAALSHAGELGQQKAWLVIKRYCN